MTSSVYIVISSYITDEIKHSATVSINNKHAIGTISFIIYMNILESIYRIKSKHSYGLYYIDVDIFHKNEIVKDERIVRNWVEQQSFENDIYLYLTCIIRYKTVSMHVSMIIPPDCLHDKQLALYIDKDIQVYAQKSANAEEINSHSIISFKETINTMLEQKKDDIFYNKNINEISFMISTIEPSVKIITFGKGIIKNSLVDVVYDNDLKLLENLVIRHSNKMYGDLKDTVNNIPSYIKLQATIY